MQKRRLTSLVGGVALFAHTTRQVVDQGLVAADAIDIAVLTAGEPTDTTLGTGRQANDLRDGSGGEQGCEEDDIHPHRRTYLTYRRASGCSKVICSRANVEGKNRNESSTAIVIESFRERGRRLPHLGQMRMRGGEPPPRSLLTSPLT
jgi:hypothetical protein